MKKQSYPHTLIGTTLANWLELLAKHRKVSLQNLHKAVSISASTTMLSLPYLLERRQFAQIQTMEEYEITNPPIFVVGHWRSGTTFLQNIVSQDPYFGYLNVIQSVFPHNLNLESLFARFMQPGLREMDNISLDPKSPSEEEIAMAALGPASFWHGYYFPQHLDTYFQKYILFQGLTHAERARWQADYMLLIRKLTWHYGGRQLVLKNPPNTSRIKELLELFPDAKFIHIYRNPWKVYLSRMNQYDNAVQAKALQPITRQTWENCLLRYYPQIMEKHFAERTLIPTGNYAEVRFETFKANPLGELERIYNELQISDFTSACPYFQAYLTSLTTYQQNRYELDAALIEKVSHAWHPIIERLGYQPPILAPVES